jgi:hypothetical protein
VPPWYPCRCHCPRGNGRLEPLEGRRQAVQKSVKTSSGCISQLVDTNRLKSRRVVGRSRAVLASAACPGPPEGVTMTACDEPAAFGVPPPVGVAPPVARVTPPTGYVS